MYIFLSWRRGLHSGTYCLDSPRRLELIGREIEYSRCTGWQLKNQLDFFETMCWCVQGMPKFWFGSWDT
jgi:hypothetical protein